jgi:hypothetical protein
MDSTPSVNATLRTSYTCHIESVLAFCFLAWYGGQSVANKGVLRRTVNLGFKLCGLQCRGLPSHYDKQARDKAKSIIEEPTHNLAQ